MKKTTNNILLVLAGVFFSTIVKAQNIPDNTAALPSGNGMGAVSQPNAYDVAPNVTPTTFNYVRVYTPLNAITSIPAFDNTQTLRDIQITTDYKGGFGKSLLTINRNGSQFDIITAKDLRTHKNRSLAYLPYTSSYHRKFDAHPFITQEVHNIATYNEGATGYSKTIAILESGTPTVKIYAPGRLYVGEGNGVTVTEHYNAANTVYKLIRSSYNKDICTDGYYDANELMVTKKVNTDGLNVITYKDRSGHVIRKDVQSSSGVLTTCYMYDDWGRVIYTIPPLAYNVLSTSSNNCLGIPLVRTMCTSHTYDGYGKEIYSRTPDKTRSNDLIYDKYHRLVLSNTPEMDRYKKWAFSIFDKQNRLIMSGVYDASNNTATYPRAYWEDLIAGVGIPVTRAGVLPENTLEHWLVNGFTGEDYPATLDDCDIYTINYYDNYDKLTTSNYTNLPASTPTSFSNTYSSDYLVGNGMITPKAYMYAHGKLVATQTKILDNGYANNFVSGRDWITTVNFYDVESKLIQTQTQNPWNTTDWDIVTMQYNFSGQKVLDISKFNSWVGSTKPTTKIQNKYNYNINTGRLESVKQKVGNSIWQDISSYEYDDLGNVSTKWLGNVEKQEYDYSMRGNISGINADDVMSTGIITKKTFFEQLSYDIGHTEKRHDGQISGFTWRLQGSDPMSYGYAYDAAGRMTNAEFTTWSDAVTPTVFTWNNQDLDFTVSNLNYDDNGNILSIKRKGWDVNYNPATIDDLTYTYLANSNKLLTVDDAGVASAADIVDFDDVNTSGNDYSYDFGGNIVDDYNKNISITYNYQNIPIQVGSGSNTIKNIYSGNGQLLQKTIVENGNTVTYRHIGPLKFKDDDLETMQHAEGRARYDVTAGTFTYDYYVRDHIDNVRTVVEGSVSYDKLEYHAGFELISATVEESVYEQIGDVRDLSPTSTPGDQHSGKLNGSTPGKKIGAALLVHSMAGDELNLSGYGYYNDTDPNNYNTISITESMLGELLGALTGATGEGVEGGPATTKINNLLTSTNYNLYNSLKTDATNINYPRAYLNYLVFDENFDLQTQYSTVTQLRGTANAWQYMELPHTQVMPINGYIMVYFSNESDMDVFVDNQALIQYVGTLQQTQHYYPYGIAIGVGNNGATPNNKHLYQTKELQTELGLQLHDFHARQYDAQLGRFMNIDPAHEFASGYTGMGNNPANLTDPTGMRVVGYDNPQSSALVADDTDPYTSLTWNEQMEIDEMFANALQRARLNNLNYWASGARGGYAGGESGVERVSQSENMVEPDIYVGSFLDAQIVRAKRLDKYKKSVYSFGGGYKPQYGPATVDDALNVVDNITISMGKYLDESYASTGMLIFDVVLEGYADKLYSSGSKMVRTLSGASSALTLVQMRYDSYRYATGDIGRARYHYRRLFNSAGLILSTYKFKRIGLVVSTVGYFGEAWYDSINHNGPKTDWSGIPHKTTNWLVGFQNWNGR